ncbi:SRPBCC domain-containing protein, partial [Metallosphaera hakonensis]|uniref:SRPBCC domain-containing protein n=1 Tax=Metallosphaera hakonensis TaxID=79601 RepID=UPI00278C895E
MHSPFFSNERNLLECLPGIKRIEGKKFVIEARIGPLRAELSGEVKEYVVNGNKISNLLQVDGPGLTVLIRTNLSVMGDSLDWDVDYSMEGSLAKALATTVGKQAEEVSRQIIQCTPV